MELYQAAAGNNNAAGLVDVECFSERGMEYPEFLDALDGSVIPQGALFVVLRINALKYSTYITELAKFGLSSTVFSANCTLRSQKDDGSWANYNGIATHRNNRTRSESGGMWLDTEIIVKKLVAI